MGLFKRPAKAGIHLALKRKAKMDSRFRGNDGKSGNDRKNGNDGKSGNDGRSGNKGKNGNGGKSGNDGKNGKPVHGTQIAVKTWNKTGA